MYRLKVKYNSVSRSIANFHLFNILINLINNNNKKKPVTSISRNLILFINVCAMKIKKEKQ